MTAVVPDLGPAPAGQYRPQDRKVTFAGLLRSENIKFWSLRSLVRTTLAAVVCLVGLGAAATAATVGVANGDTSADPTAGGLGVLLSLVGSGPATLIVAALGSMVIAGEYSTGAIRTTLGTAPRRLQVFAAKAVVVAAVVTCVVGAAVFTAFFVGQSILASVNHDAHLGDPGVLRVVAGHVAVLTGVALTGLSLGALTRNTAAAICAAVALLFLVPLLLAPLPDFAGSELLTRYNFAATTNTLTSVTTPDAPYTASVAAFVSWIALFLAGGAVALDRRDVR